MDAPDYQKPIPVPEPSQEQWFDGHQFSPQMLTALKTFYHSMLKTANGVYSASITESGSGVNVSIPHGLGLTPSIASVSAYVLVGDISGSGELTCGAYVSATGPSSVTMDATNIYVTIFSGTGSGSRTIPIFWSAGYF